MVEKIRPGGERDEMGTSSAKAPYHYYLPQISRYQIDHRSRHAATQAARTGDLSYERSETGQAWRFDLPTGRIATASPYFRWVAAKSG